MAAVSGVTRRVQTCLENAESTTLLIGVISVIDAIVALYPQVMRDSFQVSYWSIADRVPLLFRPTQTMGIGPPIAQTAKTTKN